MTRDPEPVSHLQSLLRAGAFVVTGEIAPPKGASGDLVVRSARHLNGFVDAINVTDNQRGLARMSSWGAGIILEQHGYEAVVQMSCQHRNRIALQSDVLSMASLGVRNILALLGDPPKLGDHPDARNVPDFNSFKLLEALRTMRDEATFSSGTPLREPPQVFVGAVANPNIESPDRTLRKIEHGAQFIQTQPVFDVARFECWMKGAQSLGITERSSVLAGVMLVRSVESALYMQEHVNGIGITDQVIARLRNAPDPAEEGIKLAIETVRTLRSIPGVVGVHLMTINWSKAIPHVVEGAELLPRPDRSKPVLTPKKSHSRVEEN
ncbi:MAG: methylenetetrahydrofolate reductase [Chloroflexi bacterium]|nr:methylenetetrahydrofolate reductase [Chloroflexota bacterium]